MIFSSTYPTSGPEKLFKNSYFLIVGRKTGFLHDLVYTPVKNYLNITYILAAIYHLISQTFELKTLIYTLKN